MPINHAAHLPSFKLDGKETQTWTTGLTHTVTNAHIKPDSVIVIIHTSTPVGHWRQSVSDGSVLLTSTDVETGATFKILIF